MNTFGFLVLFSAVCAVFAHPGHYYGKHVEIEPCHESKAQVYISHHHEDHHHGEHHHQPEHHHKYEHHHEHHEQHHEEPVHHHGKKEGAEIVIHRPAPIIVKRPPTKVLVNHPPLIVKPAPVVLHRPAPRVMKHVIVKQMPQKVKVEPVYVKVMKKPTHQKVYLEEKPHCEESHYGNHHYHHE